MHVSQTLGTRQARTADFDCATLCPCKPKIWDFTGLKIQDFLFVCLCILIVPWLLCYLWDPLSRKFQQQVPQPFENPQRCRQNWREHLLVFIMRSGGWTKPLQKNIRQDMRQETVRALSMFWLCNVPVVWCWFHARIVDCYSLWFVLTCIRSTLSIGLLCGLTFGFFVWFLSVLGCSWPCDWMASLASWHAGMLFPSCLVSVSRPLPARLCRIGTKNGFKTLDWKDCGPNSGLLLNQLNILRATSKSAHWFYKIRNRALLRWEFYWFQMVSACFSQYKVHLAQSLLHAMKPGGCYGWY